MNIPIRVSVKVLLINDKNEILLMCADDPKTLSKDGKYHGRFWFPIGGEIETNETVEQAAIREVEEETGLKRSDIELGPTVWWGEFDLTLNGKLTHLKQTFIVAKTKNRNVALTKLDEWERSSVKKLEWFSFDAIKNSFDVIYPVVLPDYLPDILAGKYPIKPFEIDLAKQPKK